MDRVADHIGGAVFAFGASGHYRRFIGLSGLKGRPHAV
jgi:hypothetical protein